MLDHTDGRAAADLLQAVPQHVCMVYTSVTTTLCSPAFSSVHVCCALLHALSDKGDVINGVELALSLERLNFLKLRALHDVSDKVGDADLQNFVEEMLDEQV